MSSRRSFIQKSAAFLGSLALHNSAQAAFPGVSEISIDPASPEKDFWRQVRQQFAASPGILNLNNGGVSPTPRATLDALDYYNRMCSEAPSYFMWRILEQQREPVRENLAAIAGVQPEELTINRNATEALNTVIFGLNLKPGDEIVLSKYDYPNMINAWKQREKRDGIRLVWLDLELPSEDENYLVNAYVSKFSAKTKVVHLTHVINWSGQILPVRRIADEAKKRGIEVLVDGAHSFAVLDFKIPDLNCDYFGTALHKFLCAPYGSGMMWIRKEKIAGIWPLLGAGEPESDKINKFENLGTRSFPIEMAIGYSIDLHNLIGSRRKQERLFYLKNYWMERVKNVPGIRFYTSLKPEWSCAIGNFGIEGKKATDIANKLFNEYKIHTVAIEWEKINGVRVTPNVYTMEEDLDKLVRAIEKIAAEKTTTER